MFISPKFPQFISISTLIFPNLSTKLIFPKLFSSINTQIKSPSSQFDQSINPNPNPNSPDCDFDVISAALKRRKTIKAVDGVKRFPFTHLLMKILNRYGSSPKQAFPLSKWVEKRPGYVHRPFVFNSMIKMLAKSGAFKWALMELLNKIKKNDGSVLFIDKSLRFLIKKYVRLGMFDDAFRLYKFAKGLEFDMFDVLLKRLCRRGHVQVACEFVDKRMDFDQNWVPPLEVYHVLLFGWVRLRNIRKVKGIFLLMKQENMVPGVDTYCKLVGWYCRMGKIDEAVELIGEMRRYEMTPTRIVYDSIVDVLAGAGRLKEALGMLERFMVLEDGPTLTTYNSLVRGFCIAEDLDGAGKILKVMSSRGIVPDMTTFNNFFMYFWRTGKVEEGMGLYRKVIENGYEPNEKTFDAMLGLLCKEDRLDLAVKIRDDMRVRKLVLDLTTSKVLVRLFCKSRRFKEAVMELEELIERGFIPNFDDCETLRVELKNNRLRDMAKKVSNMVKTVSWANPALPVLENIYQRRSSIIQKAKDVSNILEERLYQQQEEKRRIRSRKRYRK